MVCVSLDNHTERYSIQHTFLSRDQDKLIITSPNSNGISYNRFSTFSTDRPLSILDPTSLGNDDSDTQLKTVIIHADTLALADSVSFLSGAISTNIVFIVDGVNGSISCNGCSFSGFPRITFAAAKSTTTLSSNMTQLTHLTNTALGSLNIHNLSAPDAVSVEFHAQTIATSGYIHSLFKASKQGEKHVISSSGLVGVNGGFSFFAGPLTMNYGDHEVVDADETTSSVNTFYGNIHGAGISIVSARPVTIGSGSLLSTQSSIVASNYIDDNFFVPTGNIDIVTISKKAGYGTVKNAGRVFSDTGVNMLGSDIHNTGAVVGHNLQVVANNLFNNTGSIEATRKLELSSKLIDNRGALYAHTLNAQSDDALFNHLGGRILGNAVSLETSYFINGSRQETAPSITKKSNLEFDDDLNASANYGIFNSNAFNAPSVKATELSAHINATILSISAKQVENINPYYKARKNEEIWDGYVHLDYASSRRVSITGQNSLNVLATEYVLNSSAIFGLDNPGEFVINTPHFQNERYRINTTGYIFARKLQTSAEEDHSAHVVPTINTSVDATSPMAVLYSFGKFDLSPLSQNKSTKLNNHMSFMQIHGRSDFYNASFSSAAVMITDTVGAGLTPECFIRHCSLESFLDNYTQTTFTSFLDNVYGLSSKIAATTEIAVQAHLTESVNAFKDKFIQEQKDAFVKAGNALTSERWGNMIEFKVRTEKIDLADYLVITVYKCQIHEEANPGNDPIYDKFCLPKDYQWSVQSIAENVAENENIPGTDLTYVQLVDLIEIYLGNFAAAGKMEQRIGSDTREVDGYWGHALASVPYEISTNSSTGNIDITLRYYKRFYVDRGMSQIHQHIIGHSPNELKTKTMTFSSFRTTKPKTPTAYNISYDDKTGVVGLRWSDVILPGGNFQLDTSLSAHTVSITSTSRNYTKKQNGQVNFRVRACSAFGSETLCGNYSALKTKTITYVGNGGGDTDPPPPPPCWDCEDDK
ncbi:hypothetical protein [Pseudoalteromonas luteoviolacea]|uniref:Uncharacterized protein n=1 Tax=Pseudoalteromonas luteoviolacea NCIMB 1942 TaxID=1365253 RepID=A0A167A4Y4_9GAMM|nr:hypothetical protein [Pseudoalteromonas luteoviolacea]KZN44989.1 hypothetical protein N482_03020 [Pseudoalteromonas luteoviolacea NCIMB 1942]